jgi:hypothetical protein
MAMKKCKDCNLEKSVNEFYKQNSRGNLASYCKPCSHARATAWHRKNSKPKKDFGRASCKKCDKGFQLKKPWQKYCSDKCQYTHANNRNAKNQLNMGSCARCGKSLEQKRQDAIYCSKTCVSMDHNFKHRAKTRVASTARRKEIYERDNGQCYICDKKLEFDSFELDHLIPVARNGNNDGTNLAVSCKFCNRSRGTKLGIRQLEKLFELRPLGEHH